MSGLCVCVFSLSVPIWKIIGNNIWLMFSLLLALFLAKDFLDERPWSLAFHDSALDFLFQAAFYSKWFWEMRKVLLSYQRELYTNWVHWLLLCIALFLMLFLWFLFCTEQLPGWEKTLKQLRYQKGRIENWLVRIQTTSWWVLDFCAISFSLSLALERN